MDNFTSINIVLDRSGSMAPLGDETIKGFNSFLAEQKKAPGRAVLSLATFASDYTLIHDCVPINEVSELTTENYRTGGYTALLDAIARTINATSAKINSMNENERPNQVLLVIITDGEENSSREFTDRTKVMEMIKTHQEIHSWSVVYLGANQDAIKTGSSLGIYAGNAMTYTSDSAGLRGTYGAIISSTTSLRSSCIGSTMNFFSPSVDLNQTDTTSVAPNTTAVLPVDNTKTP